MAELEAEASVLEDRLLSGEAKITEAREQGQTREVARWEQLWIELLDQYERLCDEIASRRVAGRELTPAD